MQTLTMHGNVFLRLTHLLRLAAVPHSSASHHYNSQEVPRKKRGRPSLRASEQQVCFIPKHEPVEQSHGIRSIWHRC